MFFSPKHVGDIPADVPADIPQVHLIFFLEKPFFPAEIQRNITHMFGVKAHLYFSQRFQKLFFRKKKSKQKIIFEKFVKNKDVLFTQTCG